MLMLHYAAQERRKQKENKEKDAKDKLDKESKRNKPGRRQVKVNQLVINGWMMQVKIQERQFQIALLISCVIKNLKTSTIFGENSGKKCRKILS